MWPMVCLLRLHGCHCFCWQRKLLVALSLQQGSQPKKHMGCSRPASACFAAADEVKFYAQRCQGKCDPSPKHTHAAFYLPPV